MIYFSVSGVETYWWLPVLAGFTLSSICSIGGVSGAFLLLPFQISILGFVSPAVSPTNLLYNVLAIPSGVYRYHKEKRLLLPLVGVMCLGVVPGLFAGVIFRVKFLPNPVYFKFFIAIVLIFILFRLIKGTFFAGNEKVILSAKNENVENMVINFRQINFLFTGNKYKIPTFQLIAICFAVGVISGTYGIGGGAIVAPLLVSVYRLPVYFIAGATLTTTFLASIAGILFYTVLAPYFSETGLAIAPDWKLGLLFGLGGILGMYTGARLQKYFSEKFIKIILACAMLIIIVKYVLQFFQNI